MGNVRVRCASCVQCVSVSVCVSVVPRSGVGCMHTTPGVFVLLTRREVVVRSHISVRLLRMSCSCSSTQSTAAGSNDPSPSASSSSHHHQFNLPEGGLSPGGNHHGGVLVQAPPRHAHYTWDWLYYYIPAEEVKGMRLAVVCSCVYSLVNVPVLAWGMHPQFCMQLTKAYVAETSCNQLQLID